MRTLRTTLRTCTLFVTYLSLLCATPLRAFNFSTNAEMYKYSNPEQTESWEFPANGGAVFFSSATSCKIGIKQGSSLKREIHISRKSMTEVGVSFIGPNSTGRKQTINFDRTPQKSGGDFQYWIVSDAQYLLLGTGTEVTQDSLLYMMKMQPWQQGASFKVGFASKKQGWTVPTAFFNNLRFDDLPQNKFWQGHNVYHDINNKLVYTASVATPGSCFLRFDLYDRGTTGVLLKRSTSGSTLQEIRFERDRILTVGGSAASYKRPAGTLLERLWIDYHGTTLTVGSIDATGAPKVLLTTNYDTPLAIGAFEVKEEGGSAGKLLTVLENSNFMNKELHTKLEDKAPEQFHHAAIPADRSQHWTMYFQASEKAECLIKLLSGKKTHSLLNLGTPGFEKASYTSTSAAGIHGKYEVKQDHSNNWRITATPTAAPIVVFDGPTPAEKFLKEPSAPGQFNNYWVTYYRGLIAFGHGRWAPKNGSSVYVPQIISIAAQPTGFSSAAPDTVGIALSSGTLKGVEFHQALPQQYLHIVNEAKKALASQGGSSDAVGEIFDKRSEYMSFGIPAENQFKNYHTIPLSAQDREKQRVAFTFKSETLNAFIGLSERDSKENDYAMAINGYEIPGHMAAYYRNEQRQGIKDTVGDYSYIGQKKEWINGNPDGTKKATSESIYLKFIAANTHPQFKHAFLQKNIDMWALFDNGWLAYGHGTEIGQNIGMVWHFKPSDTRRPVNYLVLNGWSAPSEYYAMKFIEKDDAAWTEIRKNLQQGLIAQMGNEDLAKSIIGDAPATKKEEEKPAEEVTTATKENDTTKQKSTDSADTGTDSPVTSESGIKGRTDIALPAKSAQSWICTFTAPYDGNEVNKDLTFFLSTNGAATTEAEESAYKVIFKGNERVGIQSRRREDTGKVKYQEYELARDSADNPFDVWKTGGLKEDFNDVSVWVVGDDNGKFGVQNSARLRGLDANMKHWICYSDGYLATGTGDGPSASNGVIGLVWKMKPHASTGSDARSTIEKLSFGGTSPVKVDNVAITAASATDRTALQNALSQLVSGKRNSFASSSTKLASIVTHMRQEVGLPSESLTANDNKVFLASPIKESLSQELSGDQQMAQKFIATFTANTHDRIAMRLTNKDTTLASFVSSPWRTTESDGFFATIMNQGNEGRHYVQETPTSSFNTPPNDTLQEDMRISLKNQPLKKGTQHNPLLSVQGEDTQYWFYYDGAHFSFGHGSVPAAGNVGLTWKLLKPLSAPVHAFEIMAGNNILLIPKTDGTIISLREPTESETTLVTSTITNQGLADFKLGAGNTVTPLKETADSVAQSKPQTDDIPKVEEKKSTTPTTSPTPQPNEEEQKKEKEEPKTPPTPEPAPVVEEPEVKDTWLDLDVEKNHFLIRFNATATDAIRLLFASASDDTPAYTIELGKNKKNGSHIFKLSKTPHVSFPQTSVFNNTDAINYWLAYYKEEMSDAKGNKSWLGHFVLGQGFTPGAGTLINWSDENPIAFSRCKLAGSEDTVFTEPVLESIPLTLKKQVATQSVTATNGQQQRHTQYVAVGNNGTFNQWRSDWTLPGAGHGTIFFNARTRGSIHIGFASDVPASRGSQRPAYELVIDDETNRHTILKKDGQTVGEPLSTEALLPRDTMPHPYWCTYDSDTKAISFGRGTAAGTNELVRATLTDAPNDIRYFSLTNAAQDVIYSNIRTQRVVQASTTSYIARPGNGLAVDWKKEWYFTNAIRFDVKAESGVVIALGPSATEGETDNTYRVRLSNEYNADLIEGDNDRRRREVADDSVDSLLPNDGNYHSFWLQRRGGGSQPAVIKLGTWSAGTAIEEHQLGDVTLLEWEDTVEPVSANYFSFAAYEKAAFIKNIENINARYNITQASRSGGVSRGAAPAKEMPAASLEPKETPATSVESTPTATSETPTSRVQRHQTRRYTARRSVIRR